MLKLNYQTLCSAIQNLKYIRGSLIHQDNKPLLNEAISILLKEETMDLTLITTFQHQIYIEKIFQIFLILQKIFISNESLSFAKLIQKFEHFGIISTPSFFNVLLTSYEKYNQSFPKDNVFLIDPIHHALSFLHILECNSDNVTLHMLNSPDNNFEMIRKTPKSVTDEENLYIVAERNIESTKEISSQNFFIVTKNSVGSDVTFADATSSGAADISNYIWQVMDRVSELPGNFILIFPSYSLINFVLMKTGKVMDIFNNKKLFFENGNIKNDECISKYLSINSFKGSIVLVNINSPFKERYNGYKKVMFGLPSYRSYCIQSSICSVLKWVDQENIILVDSAYLETKVRANFPSSFLEKWEYEKVDISIERALDKF